MKDSLIKIECGYMFVVLFGNMVLMFILFIVGLIVCVYISGIDSLFLLWVYIDE